MLDLSLASPMPLERQLEFWAARGSRIGRVLADGSIEWLTSESDVRVTRAFLGV